MKKKEEKDSHNNPLPDDLNLVLEQNLREERNFSRLFEEDRK